jgi:hypothetical protein
MTFYDCRCLDRWILLASRRPLSRAECFCSSGIQRWYGEHMARLSRPSPVPKHQGSGGLQCAFGNASGAIASAMTGFLLDRTGNFVWAFAVAAAFCILGVFCWNFLVGPVEPVIWTRKAPVVSRPELSLE